jgi:hypothetical protein
MPGWAAALGLALSEEDTFVRRVEKLARAEGANWETVDSAEPRVEPGRDGSEGHPMAVSSRRPSSGVIRAVVSRAGGRRKAARQAGEGLALSSTT